MNLATLQGYGGLDGLLDQGLDQLVDSIEIQTTFGPPVRINQPFREKPDTASSIITTQAGQRLPSFDLARALKPRIIVKWRTGGQRVYAPYGDPGVSRWPWVTVGGVAILGFLVYRAFFRRCSR